MFLFIKAAIVPDMGVLAEGPRSGVLNEPEVPPTVPARWRIEGGRAEAECSFEVLGAGLLAGVLMGERLGGNPNAGTAC